MPLPLLLLVPAMVQAAPNWDGTYTLQSGKEQVPAAIEKSVAGLNAFMKPIWRKKLEGREKFYDSILILVGTNLSISFGKESPLTVPIGGSTSWKRSDGEAFQATMRKDGETIVLNLEGNEGQRSLAFTLTGGALTERITVKNPKLSAPLEYTLEFRKSQ